MTCYGGNGINRVCLTFLNLGPKPSQISKGWELQRWAWIFRLPFRVPSTLRPPHKSKRAGKGFLRALRQHIKTCKVKIKAGEKWLDTSHPSPPPTSCLHHVAGRSLGGRGCGSRSHGSRSHFLGLVCLSSLEGCFPTVLGAGPAPLPARLHLVETKALFGGHFWVFDLQCPPAKD